MRHILKTCITVLAVSLTLTCPVWGAEYTVEEVTVHTASDSVYEIGAFSHGLAPVRVYENKQSTYGYVDASGTMVIPPRYYSAQPFQNGVAVVSIYKDGVGPAYGLIDREGNEIMACQWRSLFLQDAELFDPETPGLCSDDVISVRRTDFDYNTTWTYLGPNGTTIIPEGYHTDDLRYAYGDGMLALQADNGTYTFCNIETGKVLPCAFDGVHPFSEGLAPAGYYANAYNCVMYGFIDKTGKMVIDEQYFGPRSFHNGLSLSMVSATQGDELINRTGKVLLRSADDLSDYIVENYRDGLIRLVSRSDTNMTAFCDQNGKIVIPLTRGTFSDFTDGVAYKSVDGKIMLVDKTGKQITPRTYDNFINYSSTYTQMKVGELYGVLDHQGNEAALPQYSYISAISEDGYAQVTQPGAGYFIVDLHTTEEIAPSLYRRSFFPSDGLIRVEGTNLKWGYVDMNGDVVIPCVLDEATDFSDGVASVEYKHQHLILANPLSSEFVPATPATPTTPTVSVVPITATPTSSKVVVDGDMVAFEAYNIGGNNYVKLRDVATVLRGTSVQFQVGYDKEKGAIDLVSNTPYTTIGGEMAKGDGSAKSAVANQLSIYLDGTSVALTAYNIQGNNYFKLRDLGQLFDFNVSWDDANGQIIVASRESYTPD